MAACGVNGNVVWGSIQGLSLKGERWTEQLNPQGHGFIVQRGRVFQKCWGEIWHKFCFFLGDLAYGGVIIGLAHLD